MIEDITLRVDPRTAAEPRLLEAELKRDPKLSGKRVNEWRIRRRSIDARQRRVMVNLNVEVAWGGDSRLPLRFEPVEYKPLPASAPSAVIVGAGPAGLFAALKCISLGVRPIVLERGADVDERRKTLARISREGIVDPDSNYCFGEGGAGAYSDGKLYTRSKKRGNVEEVLQALVQHGASEQILIDAHPHIGSDRLPGVIAAIRRQIIDAGGEVHFHTRVEQLITDAGEVKGVRTADGSEFRGPVILATGHSARDVYRMLKASGIGMEAKGLAIGVRLEHPQQLIDRVQYHSPEGRGKYLPAAEYSFVEQVEGRGVYSFCMCPGGIIVPAASGPEQLVVNGMSPSNRGSRWSNSGMVVEVHPGDFPEFAEHGELEMLALQEKLENDFYLAAGRTLKAPAQRMTDFVNGKVSTDLPPTSYAPGLQSLPMHFLLPPFISKRLREGFRKMGRKSRGFLTPQATLIGLESRTSSPVRIPRDPATMTHVSTPGLYPVGEGAGYAGGIVSAAIDGIRAAEALAQNIVSKNPHTMILNLESSTACCSAALTDEGQILEERIEREGMNHARLLAPFADDCMAYLRSREGHLDAVAVSIGPGSYTGLRIGLSLAKGLCMGMDVPLIGIPTLQILAVKAMFKSFDWEGDELLVPMLDARRMEVYTAVYNFRLEALEEPHPLILEADSFKKYLDAGKKLIFIGEGAAKYEQLLPASAQVVYMPEIIPTAAGMMALSEKYLREGRFLDTAYSVPDYLKDFQATVPKNRVIEEARGGNVGK